MHQNAKKKWSFKRRRKQLKKTRAKVKDQDDRKEGATYETGIGITEEGTALSKGVLNETMSSFAKDDLEKIEALVTQTTPETVVTPSEDNQTDEVDESMLVIAFYLTRWIGRVQVIHYILSNRIDWTT